MSDCVVIRKAVDSDGYAHRRVDGKLRTAHRVAFQEFWGVTLPSWLLVCHECDNRRCENVEHLFLGTHADNIADCVAKGRNSRGSARHCAKLTEETAVFAMARLLAGEAQASVAQSFGVTQAAISYLWLGKTWAHAFAEGR